MRHNVGIDEGQGERLARPGAQHARLDVDGTCKLDTNNECPPECHDTHGVCLPRFPFDARPGFVEFGDLAAQGVPAVVDAMRSSSSRDGPTPR